MVYENEEYMILQYLLDRGFFKRIVEYYNIKVGNLFRNLYIIGNLKIEIDRKLFIVDLVKVYIVVMLEYKIQYYILGYG